MRTGGRLPTSPNLKHRDGRVFSPPNIPQLPIAVQVATEFEVMSIYRLPMVLSFNNIFAYECFPRYITKSFRQTQ